MTAPAPAHEQNSTQGSSVPNSTPASAAPAATRRVPAAGDPLTKLDREAQAVAELRRYLAEDAGDEQLLADSIEGETGFAEAVDALLAADLEDEVIITGGTEALNALKARVDAAKARKAKRRDALALAFVSAGLTTSFRRPLGTLTPKSGPPKVEVEDEADVPSQFFKAQPNKLDRAGLLKALKDADGGPIPGARLVPGAPSVQIRRS